MHALKPHHLKVFSTLSQCLSSYNCDSFPSPMNLTWAHILIPPYLTITCHIHWKKSCLWTFIPKLKTFCWTFSRGAALLLFMKPRNMAHCIGWGALWKKKRETCHCCDIECRYPPKYPISFRMRLSVNRKMVWARWLDHHQRALLQQKLEVIMIISGLETLIEIPSYRLVPDLSVRFTTTNRNRLLPLGETLSLVGLCDQRQKMC